MKSHELVQKIADDYEEHLEMSPHPENMLIEILANKLIQQTELTKQYKERLKYYEIAGYRAGNRSLEKTSNI
jgi:hypothetical protein